LSAIASQIPRNKIPKGWKAVFVEPVTHGGNGFRGSAILACIPAQDVGDVRTESKLENLATWCLTVLHRISEVRASPQADLFAETDDAVSMTTLEAVERFLPSKGVIDASVILRRMTSGSVAEGRANITLRGRAREDRITEEVRLRGRCLCVCWERCEFYFEAEAGGPTLTIGHDEAHDVDVGALKNTFGATSQLHCMRSRPSGGQAGITYRLLRVEWIGSELCADWMGGLDLIRKAIIRLTAAGSPPSPGSSEPAVGGNTQAGEGTRKNEYYGGALVAADRTT
jgi:hypothetical protein